jgi:hypothetical protein
LDFLMSKRDLRNGWAMGKIYDSAAGEWKLLGTTARAPLKAENIGQTFETLHPSVAERAKAGAACVPSPYQSAALGGVDVAGNLSPLAPLETQLRWQDADIKPPPAKPKLQTSILGWVLRAVGAG